MRRLIPLLLVLALLCACAGSSNDPAGGVETSGSVNAGSVGGTSLPPKLDSVAVEGAPGFYNLSDLPQLSGYAISASLLTQDNVLWFLAGSKGEELHRLELDTGAEALVAGIPVEEDVEWVSTGLLSTAPLVVSQSGFSHETVYAVGEDGSLTPLAGLGEEDIPTWNAYFTDTDCIWMDSVTDRLVASPLNGEPARVLRQIPAEYFYCALEGLTADRKEAVVSANWGRRDSVLMTLSLESGEITGTYGNDEEGEALGTLLGGTSCHIRSNEDMTCYTLTAQEGERRVQVQFDLSLLARSDAPLEGRDWWMDCGSVQSFWGRSLVSADHYADRNWLLLWDYSEAEAETAELTALVAYTPPAPVREEDLRELAARLEQTYGISIHTGEDMDAPFPDYEISPCDDTYAAANALNTLEAAFALYPEDFFRQLGGDSIRGFSFYLCGQMTALDPSSSIDNPGGLSCQVDGVELLAFDVTGEIRVQDVVHELTHVLDHWLWEGDVLSEDQWSRLNPPDFTYYYAYVNPQGESYEWAGDTKYTAWDAAYYDGDADSVWFVDPYSTTYPTEDRARLMEYLLSDPDNPPGYYQSQHVQAKLHYYFHCIREKFDDSAWPEQTAWEAALGPVD